MENENFRKLVVAMEAADIAWWEMKLPGGEITFGETKATMLGYDPKDFKHYKDFTDLVDPADYEPMMEDMRMHMRGERDIYETMYRIKCADGTYKQFYDRGRIVSQDGENIVIAGFVTNVNDIQDYAYGVTKQLREASKNTGQNEEKGLK